MEGLKAISEMRSFAKAISDFAPDIASQINAQANIAAGILGVQAAMFGYSTYSSMEALNGGSQTSSSSSNNSSFSGGSNGGNNDGSMTVSSMTVNRSSPVISSGSVSSEEEFKESMDFSTGKYYWNFAGQILYNVYQPSRELYIPIEVARPFDGSTKPRINTSQYQFNIDANYVPKRDFIVDTLGVDLVRTS